MMPIGEYEDGRRLEGQCTIRQWGNNYLRDSGLMEAWQDR